MRSPEWQRVVRRPTIWVKRVTSRHEALTIEAFLEQVGIDLNRTTIVRIEPLGNGRIEIRAKVRADLRP